ncbi:MAG: SulP family inorganic anion transporter [Pirellulales bacterium]
MSEPRAVEVRGDTPDPSLAGLKKNWKADLLSGFLVFLIALPLCLAIANASGYPPIGGIMTAIIGGIVATFLSNSQLTIKGPAAGMIVIVLGSVLAFEKDIEKGAFPTQLAEVKTLVADSSAAASAEAKESPEDAATRLEKTAKRRLAYRLSLGVAVIAGLVQVVFALMRTGVLSEFFPTSTVHGMLAAIGVIIFSKQIHPVIGSPVSTSLKPLTLIAKIPEGIMGMNPEIACIGIISLIIMFGLPFIKNKYVKRIPAPMLVLLVAMPLAAYFDLADEHVYEFNHAKYSIGPKFLVDVPKDLASAVVYPMFQGVTTTTGIWYIVLFSLVGSLESVLSAKAVDLLDPWQRKSNMNKDLLATGAGNTLCACVGALPMISEIVRSSANINNGARTRFANCFHALFLLAFVVLVPGLIHRIPLAALGAMLVFTGFRLASPKEFAHTWNIGKEQLVIFLTTLITVLLTDLLIGVAAGIAMKFLIHLVNGVSPRELFSQPVDIDDSNDRVIRIAVRDSAIFSSWIPFKRQLESIDSKKDVVVDLSQAHLVDHTVMEKLAQLQRELANDGRKLEVVGLEGHKPLSSHPMATRKKVKDLDGQAGPGRNGSGVQVDDEAKVQL